MKEYGLVSIITPAFNCGGFIADTIKSVQGQTYKNWELLITDDCSSDNSQEIISQLAKEDQRIRYFKLAANSGAGVARNNSIKESKGRFIAFLDSDDMWLPDKLERQLAFMEEKQCAFSYTSYMTCNQYGRTQGIVIAKNSITLAQDIRDNKIGFSTCMYDTTKIGKVFMPIIRKRQDWGLGIRILQVCKVAYGLKQPLTYYRIGQNSLSKDKRSLIQYHIGMYMEVLGWPRIKATIYFLFVNMPSTFFRKFFMRLINNY